MIDEEMCIFARTMGERLRVLRAERNLSIAQVAEETNIYPKWLTMIENGEFPKRFGSNELYRLCLYFGTTVSFLFGEE